jgi:hypothetical protein
MGLIELGFYWDTTFNGTADCIRHALVEIVDRSARDLFNNINVTRTWISLKQRFPLLGASTIEHLDGEGADFVVTESRLRTVAPDEINFSSVGSRQEAQCFALNILNTERTLSNELLGQIFILRRTDAENQYHILLHIAHLITDGMGNTTLLRTFLDTISLPVDGYIPDLEERLAMVPSSEDLTPETDFNVPRKRWRWAIAGVIWASHISKLTVCQSYLQGIAEELFLSAGWSYPPAKCYIRYIPNSCPVVLHINLIFIRNINQYYRHLSREWYNVRQRISRCGPNCLHARSL